MSEGRALVYPQTIAFGARPLAVPGRGSVLCASAFFPFRCADGSPVAPADWYQAVSIHGGRDQIPDSMAPLSGAEVMVVGALSPVDTASRKAHVRCGSISCRFVLYPDPAAPDAPISPDPSAALWHKDDNPSGRGGPDDDRSALILSEETPGRPLWLGSTPFDHPVRLRRVGTPDDRSGTGWPFDVDTSVLNDAHEAFWGEALHPGEPLELEGLSSRSLATSLPPYRISITSGRVDGRWIVETTRIHCVMLIPGADLGAVIWRTGIDLGDDILGESVAALVAALEDADSPVQDAEHWGDIAADRWLDPVRALDDRPLLPAALAASVALPFSVPSGGDPMDERHAAAEEWMRGEVGVPEENPFASRAPEEVELIDKAREATSGDDEPPDLNVIGDLAQAAIAAGKRRHAAAGFKEIDTEQPREPKVRGLRLDTEMDKRLLMPYCTQHEIAIAEQIRANAAESLDAEDVLGKLAGARIQNPNPPLYWPALNKEEALRFGNRLFESLSDNELNSHIDVSGAIISSDSHQRVISGRRVDGLLAEETVWRDVQLANCELIASSFAGGRFEACTFQDCRFERVNLSRATLIDSKFVGCTFHDMQISELTWMDCSFERCVFERLSMSDPAMRDLKFSGGVWREVEMSEGLLVNLTLHKTEMREVTFVNTHAPYSRFEQLLMFKVWALGKGFPASVFEEVEATTCGFLSTCHFDETHFIRTRFTETGFTNAVFKDAHFTPGCQFDACDLSGVVFENTELCGVRFLQCALVTSTWSKTKASDAWFFGAILRGIDFADTEFARAVFTDADVEGAKFQPDKTIGADFRGALGATP